MATITNLAKVFIWCEDMLTGSVSEAEDQEDPGLVFSCTHKVCVRPKLARSWTTFDISFMDLESDFNSQVYEEFEVDDQSKLLDVAGLDIACQLKQTRSELEAHLFEGMQDQFYSEYTHSNSQDFLVVVLDKEVIILRLEGLRSISAAQNVCSPVEELQAVSLQHLPSPILPLRIISSKQDCLNSGQCSSRSKSGLFVLGDSLSLTFCSQHQSLAKVRIDLN